jgi:hypothetical protein
VLVNGMGHNLPRELWPELAERVVGLVQRAEAASVRHPSDSFDG